MEIIKDFFNRKVRIYSIIRILLLASFAIFGFLAIFISSPIPRFLTGSIVYIVFFVLTISIERKYTLYKISLELVDANNIYFIRYLETLLDENEDVLKSNLESFDLPLWGLHTAIHQTEMRYRSLIALSVVFLFGITGLVLSILFNSFAIFMIFVGPGGCIAMYVDAHTFVKSMKQSYAKYYCDELEEKSKREKESNPKVFTSDERKMAEDMALIYSWENNKTKHNGITSIYKWKETKEFGHLPRIPAVLRETAISAHKREFETNLTYSLSIFFCGWILFILFPMLYHMLSGFGSYLSLGSLSDMFMDIVTIIGILVPALYYALNMTSILGKQLTMSGISRKLSLYERFHALKYIAYFYPLKGEKDEPSLPMLISSLERQRVITNIDFARAVYDYALGCSLGIYNDHNMFFERPKLINDIIDDYSKPVYEDQAVTQKEKGTIDILLGLLTAICIPWLLGSPAVVVIVLVSGILFLVLWETILYKLILPIPSVKKMEQKIQKLKDAGIID